MGRDHRGGPPVPAPGMVDPALFGSCDSPDRGRARAARRWPRRPAAAGGPVVALLELEHLVTRFELHGRGFNVVDGVSLAVEAAETVGLVGESGSGKSLTLRSIVHTLPPAAA